MKRLATVALACSLAFPVLAKDVVTVNGQSISQEQLDQFVALVLEQGAQDTPQLRDQVKREMVGRLVAVQEAEKAGLQDDPTVKQETWLATQGILVRALMARYLEEHPISEDDLKAQYEEIKAQQASRKEFKLRHILVKEEDEAKALIKDIDSGKTAFEDAAKNDSIDVGSGRNGGELGWGPASNYVPEFAQAVEQLKKGELTAEPVKTQFGWHIIELEDERPVPFPSFEDSREQLEEMMRQEALASYQKGLLEKAEIVDHEASDGADEEAATPPAE